MSDHAYGTTLTIGGLIRSGFRLTFRNLEVLLLLAFLYVIAIVLLFFPFFPAFSTMLTLDAANSSSLDPAVLDGLWWKMLLLIPLGFFVYGMFYVAWARTVMVGKAYVLEGGFGALMRRAFWVAVRYLALVGYSIVIVIPLSFILGLIVGIAGVAAGPQALLIFQFVLTVAILIPMVYVVVAFIFSASAASMDRRLGLWKAFTLTKGNRSALFWSVATVYGVFYILLLGLSFLLVAGISGDTPQQALQFMFSPAGIVYYILLSVIGVVVFAAIVAMVADAYRQLSGDVTAEAAERTF